MGFCFANPGMKIGGAGKTLTSLKTETLPAQNRGYGLRHGGFSKIKLKTRINSYKMYKLIH